MLKPILIFGSLLLLVAVILLIGQSAVSAQAEIDMEELELGARLYAENCAVCHGAEGQGRVGASLSKDWPSINPGATVRTIIASGIPGSFMPAWGQASGGPFNDREIDAITAFILSWQSTGIPDLAPLPTATLRPPIEPVPEVEGDPNRGAVLYDENCAVCHGPNGEGRIGARVAKNWPSVRPDLTVRATISQGIPGTTMPAWSFINGGPLSEDDIGDITSFIMTLPPQENPVPPAEVDGDASEESPFSGFAGVLVGGLLFALIVAAALWFQRRK